MRNTVLADRIPFSNVDSRLKDVLLVLSGSLILAISAKFYFYLPFSTVPVTGHTFAVLLLAATLGATRGCAAVIVYILEGLAGLSVFSGATTGLAILHGTTFGYLIGFALAAYWVGKLAESGKEKTFRSALPAFLQGYAIIFVCGIVWLSFFIGFPAAVFQGFVVFIPGEILKLALLSTALPTAWKLVK